MKTETSFNHETPPAAKPLLVAGLARFHENFPKNGNVYLEDSVLWYCIDMGIDWYLSLPIHSRINFKQSYFDMACH